MKLLYVKQEKIYWKVIIQKPRTVAEIIFFRPPQKKLYCGSEGEWYEDEVFGKAVDKKTSNFLDSFWTPLQRCIKASAIDVNFYMTLD